jgi:peptidoglycan/LPS O-acetylase OafA/YrhL
VTSVDDGTPESAPAYAPARASVPPAAGGGPTVLVPPAGNDSASAQPANGRSTPRTTAPTTPIAPATGVAVVPSKGVAAVPANSRLASPPPRGDTTGPPVASGVRGSAAVPTADTTTTRAMSPVTAWKPTTSAQNGSAMTADTMTADTTVAGTTDAGTPVAGTTPANVATSPGQAAAPPSAQRIAPTDRRRLTGLDGMRGLAALFVVFHHSYLAAYPGYPAITGPWWASWFIYGHFAVVVFIVLSGFSLSVGAARSGWRLGGKAKFAKRRAWRILPPYWAALVFSLAIAWAVVPQSGEGSPTAKSVVINGLLVQDVFGAPSPNGAFWSIAVEAQLYVVFPLMLLLLRRGSAAVMLSVVGCVVALIGILAPSMPAVEKLMRLTPQFAVLFGLGVVAAGILVSSPSAQRLPWHWFAAFAAIAVFALIEFRGSIWTVAHFFWVDMLVGIPVALLLAAVATGHPVWLLKVLDLPPIRRLGSFSYSLYLIHAPILTVVSTKLVAPHLGTGSAAFLAMLGIAGTISVAFAWLFATVFEIPFQRHRSWEALREAARARIRRLRAVTDPSNARLVAAAANAGPSTDHITEPSSSSR